MLYNQFKILQQLTTDNNDAEHYGDLCTVLQHGYETEYHKIFGSIYKDVVSKEDCTSVMDVLDMFRVLQASYEALADKSGIDQQELQFSGFDGNNETELMAYAQYLRDEGERWQDVLATAPMNSHAGRRDFYGRMLERMEEAKDQYTLTKEEIKRVLWWNEN